jgi:hypothetical protein
MRTVVLMVIVMLIGCRGKIGKDVEEFDESELGYPRTVNLVEGMKNSGAILKLSDIADSIKFIPLEETERTLFASVNYVDIDGENMIVSSYQGQLESYYFRFNLEGRFLNTIGSIGRGPAEYLGSNISLDTDSKRVILLTWYTTKAFLTFSYDGKYLGTLPIKKQQYAIKFEFLPGGRIVTDPASSGIVGMLPPDLNGIELYDSTGLMVDSVPHPVLQLLSHEKNMRYSTGFSNGNASKTGREAYIHMPDEDTVYVTSGNTIKPAFIFSKGDYSPGIKDRYKTGSKGKLPYLMDYASRVLVTATHLYKIQVLDDIQFLFEYNILTDKTRCTSVKATGFERGGIYDFADGAGFIDDLSGSGRNVFFSIRTGEDGSIWARTMRANMFKTYFGNDSIPPGVTFDPVMRDQRLKVARELSDHGNPVVILIYLKK